ncbi:hypothetical protein FACS1894109_05630 [Spirochaetia bacterium]|nr:hypothetical protein FACS1894109_05630 [Spirochaetia bacterium]
MPGNTRAKGLKSPFDRQRNRKYTAWGNSGKGERVWRKTFGFSPKAKILWIFAKGKSPPRNWQRFRHGKPHQEQSQAAVGRPVRYRR